MGNLFSHTNAVVTHKNNDIIQKTQIDNSISYKKHSNYVTWNGTELQVDIDSFEDLGFGYAKDKHNTFYNGNIIHII